MGNDGRKKPVARPGCGRAGAWDAAHRRAAESAQADFAPFQRRIHSLPRADGTVPDGIALTGNVADRTQPGRDPIRAANAHPVIHLCMHLPVADG